MTAVEQFFKDLCHLGYIEYPNECLVQDRLNLAGQNSAEEVYGETEIQYYNEIYKSNNQ